MTNLFNELYNNIVDKESLKTHNPCYQACKDW